MLQNRGRIARAFAVLGLLLSVQGAKALSIQFDYSYDANNFFATHPTAKTDLEAAGLFFSEHFTDTLTAITPDVAQGNYWRAYFVNPADNSSMVPIDNLTVSKDEILVFVGGASLGAGYLAEGGSGSRSYNYFGGTTEFTSNVDSRGQAGALAGTPTDFGPWGGSISFNLNKNWYFDPDPSTNEAFGTQADFYSVALHELAHVLGFGTSDSWGSNDPSPWTAFYGAASQGVYGAPVPLSSDSGHWANGTTSTIYGTNTVQETAMDPSLAPGTRKRFTTLDMAGMQDVGWTPVPEPAAAAQVLGGLAFLATARRRRR